MAFREIHEFLDWTAYRFKTSDVVRMLLLIHFSLPILSAHGQVLYRNGPLPSFEVATVKPLPDGPPATPTQKSETTIQLYFTPKMLVMFAFNMPEFSEAQITNAPAWMEDQYEVRGKISDADFAARQKMTASERLEQSQLMVQALLKERFHLAVHLTKREQPIYALEIAKTEPILAAAKHETPNRFGVTNNGQNYELKATGTSLDLLAHLLGRQPELTGRSTVNKTGLQGQYDVILRWSQTEVTTPDSGATTETTAPSFFTAVQEQLGLRLVPTTDLVDYVVIDHIEKPTSN